MSGLLLMLVVMVAGMAASSGVKRAYHAESTNRVMNGLTGAQVARQILDRHGLMHVPVEHVPGELTDHYDPRANAIRLSDLVHDERSVAATAIAAHEVGHALQHAKGYAPLKIRSGLLPLAIAGQQLWLIPLMLGFVFGMMGLVWIAIALYAGAVLFQVATLPVEFDASRRAGRELASMGMVSDVEASGVKRVLRAAALTYVVGAVASIATLLWYLSMFAGRE